MRCPRCHRRLRPGARCPLHSIASRAEEPAGPGALQGDADGPTHAPEVSGFSDLHELGRGGFAAVYRARRDSDGQMVALKLAHARRDARFASEAEALRRLAEVPVTPSLLGRGRTDAGHPYLVLELITGPTLAETMADQPGAGMFEVAAAATMAAELFAALSAIHRAGVIHRDLKPENIRLRPGRGLTVLDFGLARVRAAADDHAAAVTPTEPSAVGLTGTGQQMGTPHYMAPEQTSDARSANAAADLYAAGVIAFELFTGRPPFTGAAAEVIQAHAARRPPRLSTLAARAAPYDELVARLLAKQPAGRPADAARVSALFAASPHRPGPIGPAVQTMPAATAAATDGNTRRPLSGTGRRDMVILAVRTAATVDQLARLV
ncbi:MAG: serine/threonine-protein kinase, partial [Myxococcota bacterium]